MYMHEIKAVSHALDVSWDDEAIINAARKFTIKDYTKVIGTNVVVEFKDEILKFGVTTQNANDNVVITIDIWHYYETRPRKAKNKKKITLKFLATAKPQKGVVWGGTSVLWLRYSTEYCFGGPSQDLRDYTKVLYLNYSIATLIHVVYGP